MLILAMELSLTLKHTPLQMVIDVELVPPIINALVTGEFRTQKEAAWAVSNFTVGGTAEQVLLHLVCMCDSSSC